MSITQQHMLDAYRAVQHGEPAPPAPGTGAWNPLWAWIRTRRTRASVRRSLAGPARPDVRIDCRPARSGG